MKKEKRERVKKRKREKRNKKEKKGQKNSEDRARDTMWKIIKHPLKKRQEKDNRWKRKEEKDRV